MRHCLMRVGSGPEEESEDPESVMGPLPTLEEAALAAMGAKPQPGQYQTFIHCVIPQPGQYKTLCDEGRFRAGGGV